MLESPAINSGLIQTVVGKKIPEHSYYFHKGRKEIIFLQEGHSHRDHFVIKFQAYAGFTFKNERQAFRPAFQPPHFLSLVVIAAS